MGEEKKKKESNNNNNNNTKSNVTVVLKADLHCEGCATKVLKCIRSFDGVETASIDDGLKIRVVGKVDPVKLREKVEHKTHKKVELISPLPKNDKNNKENNNNNNNTKGKGNNNNINENKQKEEKNNNNNNTEEKKPKAKEPSVTTAVFKVHLHCEGCIQKIYKTVTKTKGYEEMKVDKEKELVTIRGAIDMKALGETLKKNLKKEVQLVEPKKENNNKEKKKKEANNDNDNDNKEGEEKESSKKGEKKKAEGNKMDFNNPDSNPYIYGPPGLGVVGDQQFHYYHAPQIFSDENPNACTVM